MRKVGVEIEFAGLDLAQASDIIEQHLSVSPELVSAHEQKFHEKGVGDWRLEVDFDLLKRLSRDQNDSEDEDLLRGLAINALSAVASLVTPLELVSPPLPEAKLPELDSLVGKLGEGGAVGTGESPINAFGVHFNPEAALEADAVTGHIRAFLCLYDWLKSRDSTDLARRITPYIDPFPEAYEVEVLQADFRPDIDALIEHYLKHNPTRNRALDLLPLMAEIDPQKVRDSVEDDLIKPRPTYHYRLPNSRIGEADWCLMNPWQDWLTVERLAADQKATAALASARLKFLEQGALGRRNSDWIEQCQNAVADL